MGAAKISRRSPNLSGLCQNSNVDASIKSGVFIFLARSASVSAKTLLSPNRTYNEVSRSQCSSFSCVNVSVSEISDRESSPKKRESFLKTARPFILSEIENPGWTLEHTLHYAIEADGTTAKDWLSSIGVEYHDGYTPRADLYVEKESYEMVRPRSFLRRPQLIARRMLRPTVVVIGEPYEFSKLAYWSCDPSQTLSIAPGDHFERTFYASKFPRPELKTWSARLDRICWIARPYPWRVNFVRSMIDAGIPIDVFSKYDWGLPCWRGPVLDTDETLRRYRYSIAAENFKTHGYHSEKLFQSIRSGCVTFYDCDPNLNLPHTEGLWSPMKIETMLAREENADKILRNIDSFIYGGGWKTYSAQSFWKRILLKGLQSIQGHEELRRILNG